MKLIFLLGAAGSGKDTIGKIFTDNGYTRVSFADIVKSEYAAKIGIDVSELHIQGPKKEGHREGIIAFAEGEKLKDPLVWLKKALDNYRNADGSFIQGSKLVITDFRRDCEVDWYYNMWKDIHDMKGVKKVHPVDLRMFYVNRIDAESNDKDVLTHFAIGKVKGINKVQPGFVDAVVHNNEVSPNPGETALTDSQYSEMKTKMTEKVKKLIYLFDL